MLSETKKKEPAALAKLLANEVRNFIDELVIPNEQQLSRKGRRASRMISELTDQARSAGLWGLFYPYEYGGKIDSLEDYLVVAEQEGRTVFSHEIFGSHTALDARMLQKFGNETIYTKFLRPMASGNALPCYAMTEPEHSGSVPGLIRASACLSNGNWHINGRKWFVSNANNATFVTVLVRTTDDEVDIRKTLSMIIVPVESQGFKIERQISVMDSSLKQSEISFNEVQVPESNLLGVCGDGINMMNHRLGIGRLLRSMHWVGLAQRCLDMMGARIHSPRGSTARLQDKQLVRQHIAKAYHAIASAREMIRVAARGVDTQCSSNIEINIAKMAASQALCAASDSAVQIFGAEGVSELTPLSNIIRIARTTRILDGTDESLISSVGRQLIDFYKHQGVYHFN
ncbi:acyl-CoA dehydrogenase [Nitrosomonas aestuarii]|uniref:Acyl-CoA dehydrogenase n=1 Tax=Nitrosomonas aestuarii TaxID=52441 RepID=A0A1I3ZUR8_9PROT|nr:acyl-CoA dehydrogenase family protein [Nitrosomonas aestuarii]SFK47451.1 acyl-CoA dehydrogenase [Nitrosomonas aestuarii]